MGKKYKILIFIFLFGCFVYYTETHTKDAVCDEYSKYVARSIKGLVVKKFIDSKEDSFPYLYIKSAGGVEKLNLYYDKNNTYESINLKDTIYKIKNNPWIYKSKNNEMKKIKLIDFGCTPSGLKL